MPWRHVVQGGIIRVFDVMGNEVQLFTMLDFVTKITGTIAAEMNAKKEPTPEAPKAAEASL